MGTIILMIAFVMEAAFETYCIITKSNQEQVRSFVRIGALAAFVILTLFSVMSGVYAGTALPHCCSSGRRSARGR